MENRKLLTQFMEKTLFSYLILLDFNYQLFQYKMFPEYLILWTKCYGWVTVFMILIVSCNKLIMPSHYTHSLLEIKARLFSFSVSFFVVVFFFFLLLLIG